MRRHFDSIIALSGNERIPEIGDASRDRYICTSINRGPGAATERLSSL